MGHVDLNQDAARADRRIIKGATEDEVVRRIDELEGLVHAPAEDAEREEPRSSVVMRKINMKAGVLLRWGK